MNGPAADAETLERLRAAYHAALQAESVTVAAARAASEAAWSAWNQARNAYASSHPPEGYPR